MIQRSVKGVFDILPYGAKAPWQNMQLWSYLENCVRAVCHAYNYLEIRTPIFEYEELFRSGVGATTDIIMKEMYSFLDRKERKLALRPEGTAPVLRSIAENGLHNERIIKLFYIAPMFRYERPQAGRYRQHHQFGVEAIGEKEPFQDAEIVDLFCAVCKKLGFKNIFVKINSIGDADCRKKFAKDLLKYFTPLKDRLSKDSKKRLETNVFRILDSKDENDIFLLDNAPNILEYLSVSDKMHFEEVLALLAELDITHEVDNRIVRGLDYYNKTVFECFTAHGNVALGGGGRYDGFTEQFGMPSLPACGFGMGIERILQTLLNENITLPASSTPFVFVAAFEDSHAIFSKVSQLRNQGVAVEMVTGLKKIAQAFGMANRLGVKYTAIYASEEKKMSSITLKDMTKRTSENVLLKDFVQVMVKKWGT